MNSNIHIIVCEPSFISSQHFSASVWYFSSYSQTKNLFCTFLSDSAEVIQSRLNEQEGREEFYVHYVGCEWNCFQILFMADHTQMLYRFV